MSNNKVEQIIKKAWESVRIPQEIKDRFRVFGLLSQGDLLHRVQRKNPNTFTDEYVFWIKGSNPRVDRYALGLILTGDELDVFNEQNAPPLLQEMVNVFLEKASYFDEGGVLPDGICLPDFNEMTSTRRIQVLI